MKLIELLSFPVTEEQRKKAMTELDPRAPEEELAGTLPPHLQDLWVRVSILVEEGIAEQKKLREAIEAEEPKEGPKGYNKIKHKWLGQRVKTARDFFWTSAEEEFGWPGESIGLRAGWEICFNGLFCDECGVHHEDEDDSPGAVLAGLLFGGLSRD